MWDSRTVIQLIWSTFGLVASKVILGSFGALLVSLTFFSKYCFFYTYDSFTAKLFVSVPYDIPHKSYLFEFWNVTFKKLKKYRN